MATFNSSAVSDGADNFTSDGQLSGNDNWNANPQLPLPAGYKYKIHYQLGQNAPITVKEITASTDLGGATSALVNAYMTYTADGSSDEVRFTNPAPSATGVASVIWNPGAGQSKAPQPSVTISILNQKPDP